MSPTSSNPTSSSTRYTTYTADTPLYRATGGSGRFYTKCVDTASDYLEKKRRQVKHRQVNLSKPIFACKCRFLNLFDATVFQYLDGLDWTNYAKSAGVPDVHMPITLKDERVHRTSDPECDKVLIRFLKMHWAAIEAWCGCTLDGYEWDDGNVSFHHEFWFVKDPIVAGVLRFPRPLSPVPQYYVRQSSPLKRSPLGLDAYSTCRPSPTKQRKRFQDSVFDVSRKLAF